jgi:hypothetical protein
VDFCGNDQFYLVSDSFGSQLRITVNAYYLLDVALRVVTQLTVLKTHELQDISDETL